MRMRSGLLTLWLMAALALPSVATAAEVYKSDAGSVDVGGQMQLLGYAERLDDGVRDDNRLYLYVRQARLSLTAKMSDVTMRLIMAFGGEEEVKAPAPGVSLGLLEASGDVGLAGPVRLRAGQFRVPYGRERVTNPATLSFADRSNNSLMFNVGRDVGAAVYANHGDIFGTVGVFTGGGRSVPQRFLPQTLGSPMFVVRVGWNHGLDDDPFSLSQQGRHVDKLVAGVYLNALWQKDSLIGHSTVFGVKTADRPLLINGNWNPFLGAKLPGEKTIDQATLTQFGADAALKMPLGDNTLSAEAEFNQGTFESGVGKVSASGARLQAGVLLGKIEVALRYATLFANDDLSQSGVKLIEKAVHEVTPALTWHLRGDNAKLVLDAPVTLNAPTVRETGVGVYSLISMPDQAGLLKPKAAATPGDPPGPASGTLVTQTTMMGRLMLQFSF